MSTSRGAMLSRQRSHPCARHVASRLLGRRDASRRWSPRQRLV